MKFPFRNYLFENITNDHFIKGSKSFLGDIVKLVSKEKINKLKKIAYSKGYKSIHFCDGNKAINWMKSKKQYLSMQKNEIFWVILTTETDFLGSYADKFILENLNKIEKNLLWITNVRDYANLSKSIYPLDFDELDRIRQPFIEGEWDFKVEDKTKNISMLYSGKTYNKNHCARKFIYEKYKNSNLIDFFVCTNAKHNKQLAFENKYNCLSKYRYLLFIDNTFDKYHIDEQLKDAFYCKSIPIYLGNRSYFYKEIEEKYNIDWCNGTIDLSKENLSKVLNNYGKEYYISKKDVVEENALAMKNYLSKQGWEGENIHLSDFSWLANKAVDLVIDKLIKNDF